MSQSPPDQQQETGHAHHVPLSVLLGLLIAFFYVDGFLRDSSWHRVVLLNLILVGLALGLVAVSNGAVARSLRVRDVALAVVGALLTAEGARHLHLGYVLAAALVGVIAGLAPRILPRVHDGDAAALYCGAFVGMTSELVIMGPQWLIVAGALAGGAWSVVREAWVGIGGKMGTMAFAGVAATAGIATLLGSGGGMVGVPHLEWRERAVLVLIAIPSALFTHWVAFHRGWGVVLASAAPTAVVAAVLLGLTSATGVVTVTEAAAWMGASFVGMTAPTRLPRRWMLPLMGAVFGVLLVLFQSNLAGLGGDLGATAAASVLSVTGLAFALDRVRHPREHHPLAH